ncbi:hypothetical protein [Brooklawnia cerclae]|uniref:Lipoprotein n=1 Tax=Brooklawnia cerclae TaxID=349934 RepID=A0ABX0SCU9_9ACTN|nr:hypothetical protein [Brooklawnia cerclae]NIH56210.1 hypothetical protein [Brooklawnia cerclae]
MAGVVVGVVWVAGCSAGQADPVVTPLVSSSSTSPTVSPTPSVDVSADALYAEAEQVYLRSLEVQKRFELRMDYSEFPPELEELWADPYLGWGRAYFEEAKAHGWHSPEGSSFEVVSTQLPGVSRDGSEVALQTCRDARGIPMLDAAGNEVGEGSLVYETLFFKHVDGRLKLFTGTTDQRDSCPFE